MLQYELEPAVEKQQELIFQIRSLIKNKTNTNYEINLELINHNNLKKKKYAFIFTSKFKTKSFIEEIISDEVVKQHLKIKFYVQFGNIMLIYLQKRQNLTLSEMEILLDNFVDTERPRFILTFKISMVMIQNLIQKDTIFQFSVTQQSENPKRNIRQQVTRSQSKQFDLEICADSEMQEESIEIEPNINPQELILQTVGLQNQIRARIQELEVLYGEYFKQIDLIKERIYSIENSSEKEYYLQFLNKIDE